MSLYAFGAGQLYARPLATSVITNPAPRRFGVTQDASVDFSGDTKELYGANQYALDVRTGKMKITISAKNAQINATQWSELFFGGTSTPGSILFADSEMQTVPAATPYTITPSFVTTTPANNFDQDKGVVYAATGVYMTQVAAGGTAPTQGQYTVSALGVYTFAAADAGASILISYSYSSTTTGFAVTVPNRFMGSTAYFALDLSIPANGEQLGIRFPKCMSSKLTLGTKIDDFMIPEMAITAISPNGTPPAIIYSTE